MDFARRIRASKRQSTIAITARVDLPTRSHRTIIRKVMKSPKHRNDRRNSDLVGNDGDDGRTAVSAVIFTAFRNTPKDQIGRARVDGIVLLDHELLPEERPTRLDERRSTHLTFAVCLRCTLGLVQWPHYCYGAGFVLRL